MIKRGITSLVAAHGSTNWFVTLSLQPVHIEFRANIQYPNEKMNVFRFIQGVLLKKKHTNHFLVRSVCTLVQ